MTADEITEAVLLIERYARAGGMPEADTRKYRRAMDKVCAVLDEPVDDDKRLIALVKQYHGISKQTATNHVRLCEQAVSKAAFLRKQTAMPWGVDVSEAKL